MFDPHSPFYAQTPEGAHEYNNVLVTLDPQLAQLPGDLVVQKMVLGTESLSQALVNLLGYYGQTDLLASASTVDLMRAAGREENPMFILTTEANTELVLSMDTYGMILMHPNFGRGSMLLTNEKLQEIVAKAQQSVIDERGGPARLLCIPFETGVAGQEGREEAQEDGQDAASGAARARRHPRRAA